VHRQASTPWGLNVSHVHLVCGFVVFLLRQIDSLVRDSSSQLRKKRKIHSHAHNHAQSSGSAPSTFSAPDQLCACACVCLDQLLSGLREDDPQPSNTNETHSHPHNLLRTALLGVNAWQLVLDIMTCTSACIRVRGVRLLGALLLVTKHGTFVL
jgi:hypothetical protein